MYENRSCISYQRLLLDLKACNSYMLHVWGHSNPEELPAVAGDLRDEKYSVEAPEQPLSWIRGRHRF